MGSDDPDARRFVARSPAKRSTSVTQASRSRLQESRLGHDGDLDAQEQSTAHLRLSAFTAGQKREQARKHELFVARLKAKQVGPADQNEDLLAWLKQEDAREKERIRFAELAASAEERLARIEAMNVEREQRQAQLRQIVRRHRLELESVPL